MINLASSEFDSEELLGETQVLPVPPLDEEFAFLPIGQGSLAMVLGPADKRLFANLRSRYDKVIEIDPSREQSSNRKFVLDNQVFKGIDLERQQLKADLIILLWYPVFFGKFDDWFEIVSSFLAPGGTAV